MFLSLNLDIFGISFLVGRSFCHMKNVSFSGDAVIRHSPAWISVTKCWSLHKAILINLLASDAFIPSMMAICEKSELA